MKNLNYGALGKMINVDMLNETNIDEFLTQADIDIINNEFAEQYSVYLANSSIFDDLLDVEFLGYSELEIAHSGEWRKEIDDKVYSFIADEKTETISFGVNSNNNSIVVVSRPHEIGLDLYQTDGQEDYLHYRIGHGIQIKGNQFTLNNSREKA